MADKITVLNEKITTIDNTDSIPAIGEGGGGGGGVSDVEIESSNIQVDKTAADGTIHFQLTAQGGGSGSYYGDTTKGITIDDQNNVCTTFANFSYGRTNLSTTDNDFNISGQYNLNLSGSDVNITADEVRINGKYAVRSVNNIFPTTKDGNINISSEGTTVDEATGLKMDAQGKISTTFATMGDDGSGGKGLVLTVGDKDVLQMVNMPGMLQYTQIGVASMSEPCSINLQTNTAPTSELMSELGTRRPLVRRVNGVYADQKGELTVSAGGAIYNGEEEKGIHVDNGTHTVSTNFAREITDGRQSLLWVQDYIDKAMPYNIWSKMTPIDLSTVFADDTVITEVVIQAEVLTLNPSVYSGGFKLGLQRKDEPGVFDELGGFWKGASIAPGKTEILFDFYALNAVLDWDRYDPALYMVNKVEVTGTGTWAFRGCRVEIYETQTVQYTELHDRGEDGKLVLDNPYKRRDPQNPNSTLLPLATLEDIPSLSGVVYSVNGETPDQYGNLTLPQVQGLNNVEIESSNITVERTMADGTIHFQLTDRGGGTEYHANAEKGIEIDINNNIGTSFANVQSVAGNKKRIIIGANDGGGTEQVGIYGDRLVKYASDWTTADVIDTSNTTANHILTGSNFEQFVTAGQGIHIEQQAGFPNVHVISTTGGAGGAVTKVDGVSPDSTGNVSFDGANGIYVQPYGTSNVVQVANNFVTERTENIPYITSTGVKPRGDANYPGYGICSQQDAELYFENGRQISKVIIRVKMDREWDGDITWTHGLYLRRRRTQFMSSEETVGECQPGNYVISGNGHTPQVQEITFLTDFTWLTPPEGQYGEDVLYVFFDTPEVPRTQFQYLQLEYATTYETPVYTKVTTLHGVGGTPLELENPMKLVGTTAKPLLTEDDLPPIPAPVVLYTTADITSPQITTKQQYLDFKASLPPFINHTVTFNFNAALATLGDDGGTFDLPGAGGSGTIRILNNYDNNFRDTTWRKCKCRLILGNDNPIIFRMTEYQNTSSLNFEDCFDVWVPAIETDPTGGVNIIYLGQLRTNNCTIGGLTSSSSGSVFFSTSCGNLVYANSTINSVTRYVRYYNHIQGHNVLDFPTYGGSFTQYYGYEKPIIFRGGGLV